jgi:TatD DNase family protein
MLIDTHCHLTSPELIEQVDAVLARARVAAVERAILVAVNPADARAALTLLDGRPNLFLVAGIHPHEAAKCTPETLAALTSILRATDLSDELRRRIVGVGETGLDLHYDFAPPARQEEVFRAHLELAGELNLPVVIHAREAEARICELLGEHPRLAGRVVFHCFSGDPAVARRVLDLGCYCSFTGVVTFKNAEAIRASARLVPGDRIMLETDAPYLSPEPVRKIRPNEPAFLVHTARFLADLRGEDFDAFAAATTANARGFFGLSEGRT